MYRNEWLELARYLEIVWVEYEASIDSQHIIKGPVGGSFYIIDTAKGEYGTRFLQEAWRV
jgi:hypothetical protein